MYNIQDFFSSFNFSTNSFLQLFFRLFLNIVCFLLIIFHYNKKTLQKEFIFVFFVISTAVFFLIYLLIDFQFNMGFAIGFLALFGIIRYRTENIPIREMSFLFLLITISLINAITKEISIFYAILVDFLLVFLVLLIGNIKIFNIKINSTKIVYNKLELLQKENRELLLFDLQELTTYKIIKIEIIEINYITKTSLIKIYFK